MGFNLFEWLRMTVRNSVIMGVHDAIGCLGETEDSDKIQQQLSGFINDTPTGIAPPKTKTRSRSTKKLGRSLKQIQTEQGTA